MKILTSRTCKLSSVNIRTEKHGEEEVLASDLRMAFTASNAVLDLLSDGLLPALYKAPPESDQARLPDENLPIRKFPTLEPVKFADRAEGRKAVIEYGLGGAASDIALDEVAVDKWSVTLLEGGSVEISFRLQCHPTPEISGKLAGLLNHEVTITVIQPPAGEQPDLPNASADPAEKTKRSRKRKGEADDDGGQAFPGAIDGTKPLGQPEPAEA